MLEFKTYDESRLNDLESLVLEVIQDWKWKPWYPNKDQLKEIYSREGFTPETRHFAYDRDKLVAFLSSAVEDIVDGVQFGSFHIPFIKSGYEYIEDELFRHTIDLLKEKGVKAIRTTTMDGWGPMPKMLEKLGFGEQKLLAMRTIFKPSQITSIDYEKPSYLIELDVKKDKELLLEAMMIFSERTKEELEDSLDFFIEHDYIFATVVNRINDDVLSYGILYEGAIYEGDTVKRAMISRIPFKEGYEQALEEVFQYLINKSNDLGIELLWKQKEENVEISLYEKYGLKLEPFYEYVLRLN